MNFWEFQYHKKENPSVASPPKFPASFASFAWHRPASPSANYGSAPPPGVASPRRGPFVSVLFSPLHLPHLHPSPSWNSGLDL